MYERAKTETDEKQKKMEGQFGDLKELSDSHVASVSLKTEELKAEVTAREDEVETLFTQEIAKDVPTGQYHVLCLVVFRVC